MQSEQWQKIERIFGEAVALSPVARERYLADACGGDFDLREEISGMLLEDADDAFLSAPLFSVGARLLGADDLLHQPEFGAYQLQKLLGRGGMGAVYLARDRRLERSVALKVLPVSIIEDEADVERFRQEARAASGVSHPNVAHIYEFGAAENRWFLAMEYAEGKTLREILKSGLPDESSVLSIVRQIADALAATHRRGIVHRDIKPENIIVTGDGIVKVLDFGLAKPDAPPVAETNAVEAAPAASTEVIFGTAAYMSPEQIGGAAVDARTDLWSLGVILFEMLAGTRPFGGDSTGDLQTAIMSQPAAIDDCPKKFRAAVGRLLQKNPADRYASAADLLVDLQLLKEDSTAKNHSSGIIGVLKERKILVSVMLLVIFGLSAGNSRLFSNFAPPVSQPAAAITSIAVLPFVSENGGENGEYLADGLTESLINKLARLSNLSVKSKNSVFRYKGATVEPPTVGRELSVQAVLHGRISEDNEIINLELDLFDAPTGNRIWSKEYNRPKNELLVLQQEVGRDVFANLNARLSGAEEQILGKNYTENPEAYRLYLKGRFHWNKRTAKDLQKSIEYYERAVALDPNFALAFAGLADTYIVTSGYGIHSPHESFPKAKAMALQALAIDDTLAEAHNALAYEFSNYEWNVVEAEKEIQLAIRLNPNYPTTHQWYATAILVSTGRFDEAVAEAKRAQALDSVSLSINTDLGSVLLFARRDDEALEQLLKTVEMDENFGGARAFLCRAYLMKKNYLAAIAECRKSQTLYNDPRPTAYLARAYADQGERGKARQVIEQLKFADRERYVSKYYFAIVYAGLGENNAAFEYLEKAFEEREGRMTLLSVDPLMDKLRADPRFENLTRRVRSLNKPD